jgi:putative tricarboxylic transport membrane protein
MKAQMKNRDLISGMFWLVLGISISIWSTRYQIGNLVKPGTGFFPFTLGLLLILLSLILLRQAIISSLFKETEARFFVPDGWKKVTYTVLVLLLAIFLFERIGYLLTTFFLIFFLMVGTKSRSWGRIIFIALITVMGVYLVFVLLLGQPFPRGLLRF